METNKLVADTQCGPFDADNIHILRPAALHTARNFQVSTGTGGRQNDGIDLIDVTHPCGPGGHTADRFGAADELIGLRSALSAIQERLSLAVDSGGVGLWEIDLARGLRSYSDRAAKIMGHPLGQPVTEAQSLAAVHPQDVERVRSTVRAMILNDEGIDTEFEYRLSREDDVGPMWVVSTGRVLRDASGRALRIVGSVRDITISRRQRDEMARMAFEDDVTKLPNRRGLMKWLAETSETDGSIALLAIDIDDFKRTIGLVGSASADLLIRDVAARIRKVLPVNKCVARLDGDEFAVAIPKGALSGKWARVAKNVHSALKRPFVTLDRRTVFLEVTIGVAMIDPTSLSIEDLVATAALSLREAKATARGGTQNYTAAMQTARMQVQTVLTELPDAVSRSEFELHYQPQVNLADGRITGAEALLRWRHPKRGLVAPAAFIDELSRSRWSLAVGTRVLETASAATAELTGGLGEFAMGVNLFASQFRGQRLEQVVKRTLERHGLRPESLEIEITENIVLADDVEILKTLNRLRDLGCGIAFDDYGTGYASLSMLKRYPVSRLKIDRSFVANICQSSADRAIVEAVLGLGRTFGIDVIAEGIETQEQHAMLLECGCTTGQGYFYGKPMPFADLQDFAKAHDGR